jgi:O-antigen/teichoic acid export membrane protein
VINDQYAVETERTLRIVAVAAPLFVLYMNCVHALKGVEAFVKFRLIERLARPLLYLVTCVTIGVGSATATLVTLQLVNLVLLVVAALALRSAFSGFASGGDSTLVGIREFWTFAAPQGVSGLLDGILAWSDTILISAILSSAAAAGYTAISRVVLVYMFSLDAAIEVGAPRFSAAAGRGDRSALRRTYHDLVGFQSSIVWPMAVPLIIFMGNLAPLVDSSLEAAVPAGRIILLGAMIATVFGPAAVLLLMMGKSRLVMVGSALALVVNLAINISLIPRWGITAAGLAWSAALIVSAATAAWFARDLAAPGLRATGRRAQLSLLASLAMSTVLYLLGYLGGRAGLGMVAVGVAVLLTLNNLRSYRRPEQRELAEVHA